MTSKELLRNIIGKYTTDPKIVDDLSDEIYVTFFDTDGMSYKEVDKILDKISDGMGQKLENFISHMARASANKMRKTVTKQLQNKIKP